VETDSGFILKLCYDDLMKTLLAASVALSFLTISHASWASPAASSPTSLDSIPVKTLDGESTTLKSYDGKVLLIVNTASRCGYTPQYEGLEALAKQYRSSGLVVLGFPSNDFGKQEPGTNKEIRFFCESKYHVDFPLFDKAPVTGSQIQPVFSWLLDHAATQDAVAWNFEKFLIGRDGKVLQRFKSGIGPTDKTLTAAIESALAQASATK